MVIRHSYGSHGGWKPCRTNNKPDLHGPISLWSSHVKPFMKSLWMEAITDRELCQKSPWSPVDIFFPVQSSLHLWQAAMSWNCTRGLPGNRKLTLCPTGNQLQLLNQSLIGHYSRQIGLIEPTSNCHYRQNLAIRQGLWWSSWTVSLVVWVIGLRVLEKWRVFHCQFWTFVHMVP